MKKKKYAVTVPVTLWVEVYAPDSHTAISEVRQGEQWMFDAVNFCLQDGEDADGLLDEAPASFCGYRVLSRFEKAVAVRGTLDLFSKDWEGLPTDEGIQHEGVSPNERPIDFVPAVQEVVQ